LKNLLLVLALVVKLLLVRLIFTLSTTSIHEIKLATESHYHYGYDTWTSTNTHTHTSPDSHSHRLIMILRVLLYS